MPRPRRLTAEHAEMIATMRAAGLCWKLIQRAMEAKGLPSSRKQLWCAWRNLPSRRTKPRSNTPPALRAAA